MQNIVIASYVQKQLFTDGLQKYGLDKVAKKETPTQLFSCKLWQIFKDTFYYRTLRVAASVCALALIIVQWRYENADKARAEKRI